MTSRHPRLSRLLVVLAIGTAVGVSACIFSAPSTMVMDANGNLAQQVMP